MIELRFYKEASGCWYADLPDYIEAGGTKEACQMVAGADDWLDVLSHGESEITLVLDTEEFEGSEYLTLEREDDFGDEFGAYYRIGSYKGIDYSNLTMWLCPVTLFVFGEYPERIYYK